MTSKRLATAAILLAGSTAIASATPAAATTIYSVPQLFQLLHQNPHAGKQIRVVGRAVFALWVNPIPGRATKRWRTGNLNAAGCQPRGFPLNPGWFILVRLVSKSAGPMIGNPVT